MLAVIRVSSPVTCPSGSRICHWSRIVHWRRQVRCYAGEPGQEQNPTVTVIGGGAAGLTAAYFAAFKLNERLSMKGSTQQGRVLVLERTKEAGKKVLMSGGTRCNVLPSEVDVDKDFVTDSSKSALRAIFASWGVWQCWSWLSEAEHVGLELSLEEESNKWFPTSNSSRQVRDKLVKACERLGVEFKYNSRVVGLVEEPARKWSQEATSWRIDLADGTQAYSDRVVVATGGLSFPTVGTDGSGLQILEHLGHKMVDPYPALTPLVGEHPKGKADEQIPGVSLDVSASIVIGKKKIDAPRTGFLFTHKGYSGPAILDLSHHFVRSTQDKLATPPNKPIPPNPKLVVRWSNKTTHEWCSSFKEPDNKATLALSMVKKELPGRLATSLYEGVVKMPKKCANLTRKEVTNLGEALGAFELSVTGHQGYKMAEVTGGGVKLEEMDCKTMESVHCPRMFLCGEVCDVFGRIGGFNFYWAWVSGRAAGLAAAGSDWTQCDV